jgi:GTP cyclohydrolase III
MKLILSQRRCAISEEKMKMSHLDTQDNTAMTGRDGAIDHVAKLELVAHEFERASEE